MTTRHYYRCIDCLTIAAADGPPVYRADCSLCGGKVENMGQVCGLRLTEVVMGCPCDGRCTGARGPQCDCKCGGVNHGSGLLVPIVRDLGPVPVLKVPNSRKAAATAEEWREGYAALSAELESIKELERQGGPVDWDRLRMRRLLTDLKYKLKEMRHHPSRMKLIRLALPEWRAAERLELQAALF